MQYTPVLNTGLNWQLYSGPGFTGAVDIPRDDLVPPAARDRRRAGEALREGHRRSPRWSCPTSRAAASEGQVALADLIGATCFANVEIQPTPDARLGAATCRRCRPGTLSSWSLSPAYDALARDPERPLSAAERTAIRGRTVEAEPPGIVAIYRYRDGAAPAGHLPSDWSNRLEPQPGTRLVYARTTIDADRDEVRKLSSATATRSACSSTAGSSIAGGARRASVTRGSSAS